jgi:hypothetical protein
LSNVDDWEDAGYRYIWSDRAIRVLERRGVENWHDVIVKVDADYRRVHSTGTVRDPERLARTMVLNAARDAMRPCSIQHGGRRRLIRREPLDRQDTETGRTYSPLEGQQRFQAKPADEALAELRNRLWCEEEQADHRSQLEQMRRQLGERLLSHSEVTCPIHERVCPQSAKVLAAAQAIVVALGNALDDQEKGDWGQQVERQRRTHRKRARLEWDQRLHQQLIHLATEAAAAEDPIMYDSSPGGRQARSRVARCILHTLWLEAGAVDFKYLAEQACVTLQGIYEQQLSRRDTSESARTRLLGWLNDHGTPPVQPEGDHR